MIIDINLVYAEKCPHGEVANFDQEVIYMIKLHLKRKKS